MTMYLKAFLIGGLICMIGQLLLLFTNLTSARILVFFVTAGVVLTAVTFGYLASVLFTPRTKS